MTTPYRGITSERGSVPRIEGIVVAGPHPRCLSTMERLSTLFVTIFWVTLATDLWVGVGIGLDGFDDHEPASSHEMAARRKRRVLVSAQV